MYAVIPDVVILYSIQLYDVAPPKMLAPLTIEPAAGPDEPPDVVVLAVVADGAPPVGGAAGPVLEQPAMATAMVITRTITILKLLIFNQIPPQIHVVYGPTLPDRRDPGSAV
jgi:hypothetical protein